MCNVFYCILTGTVCVCTRDKTTLCVMYSDCILTGTVCVCTRDKTTLCVMYSNCILSGTVCTVYT